MFTHYFEVFDLGTELVIYEDKSLAENEKLDAQRKKIERINSYLLAHPSIAVALISGYASLCGFAILWIVFYKEDINLIDYVSFGDFIFGVFSVELALPLILAVVVFLLWGYVRLLKVHWTNMNRFWAIVIVYLLFAPTFPAYMWYKPVTLCHPDNRIYSVTYKLPSMEVENNLSMIASLSNYKVFKRHDPGCDVNFGKYDEDDFDNKFQLVVIHDSAIAKIESTLKEHLL
ncbi:hypothetical protein BCT85_04085 [Vibrio lentus]|nr:hypothetical protein BCT85_04085 [Vibrio lentus]